ncbi:MAG: SRPBCC family protein [Hyphomicrobium sp.]
MSEKRTDRASRVIAATARKIYEAHLNAAAVATWRPPQGMRAEIYEFDGREGGGYRMAFIYEDASVPGKTSGNADVFVGSFVELVPERRIVERVTFQSDDPALAGAMTITTALTPVTGGTEVTVVCGDVPEGISESDHQAGTASTLANLAAFVERGGDP